MRAPLLQTSPVSLSFSCFRLALQNCMYLLITHYFCCCFTCLVAYTVNILKIRELFDFSILIFLYLGGNMLFFARVLRRLQLFAKLEAFSAAIFLNAP